MQCSVSAGTPRNQSNEYFMKIAKFHLYYACRVAAVLVLAGLMLGAPAYSQPTNVFGPGASSTVYALALQPDGKVLVGGLFSRLGGQSRTGIGRINADGTLDASFHPVNSGGVYALSVQPDGKILAGGAFSRLGGQSRSRLGRLNGDGTVDADFKPSANNYVYSLALQPDGKIVVGGAFTSLGGKSRRYVGRLNAEGTLDVDFNPESSGTIYALALQPDGMILLGGSFSKLGGQARTNLARLYSDGTRDDTFKPGVVGTVHCLALQSDGKILVGGSFSKAGGLIRTNLARFNYDGTVDDTFYIGANGPVYSLALQADGRCLVGGQFNRLGGQVCTNLARINGDGTLDATFSTGANGIVYALALQADGQVLVGGTFNRLAGLPASRLGLIPNPDLATDTLEFDGESLTWLRGGAGPEVWRATFQYWTEDSGWQELGEGERIDGGWGLFNVSLPMPVTISARGYTCGGWHDGSGSCVETTIGPPAVFTQPVSRTNNAGSSATFSVYAGGTGPLQYQWRKNGANLVDGGNVWGAATMSLTLTGLLAADQGDYSVVITNAAGETITSAAATLTVIDPLITGGPDDAYANHHEDVSLGVSVAGTPPFSYQWRKAGADLAGATDSFLSLTNVQLADDGYYDVVVANPVGVVTSRLALVSVNVVLPDEFDPGANDLVQAVAIQPDGKVLAGGYFTTLGGQFRTNLARLNADGTADAGFDPGADGLPLAFVLQTDGKIVVGGQFSTLGGESRSNLARLEASGAVDLGFDPRVDGPVNCLAALPDGKMLVGGYFTTLGGQNCTNLGRLNPDGTLDTPIDIGSDSAVNSLAVQADGKILVGGYFSALAGQTCTNLGRLNPDLTLDVSFNAGVDGGVLCLAVQADSKILVGGQFGTLGGESRSYFGRLEPDGAVDAGFNPRADGSVVSLALQADGKILVGGWFSNLGGLLRNGLGRLNADGSLDSSFHPIPSPGVSALALQADGKILVGGSFSTLGGQPRSNLGRLNNTDPAAESLDFNGSTITWLRGGTSPEVWHTTFDTSTNGTDWIGLGAGARIGGGWQLSEAALPGKAILRARGFVAEGQYNSSAWFVESNIIVNHPPVADAGATRRTAISGNDVNAQVILDGTQSWDADGDPLQCVWYREGDPNPLAHGIVAVVVLPVGGHSLALVVNDGKRAATNAFTLEIITVAQAVKRLIAQVTASWPRSQPLVATLSAVLASLDRGNAITADNQLAAFQNKVQAQVAQNDPALAAAFTRAAQEIINALLAGGSHHGGRPYVKCISVSSPAHGRARMQFAAPAEWVCVVEASTDLVTWEAIGLAEDQGDGTFAFEDENAAKFAGRYYRIRQVPGH